MLDVNEELRLDRIQLSEKLKGFLRVLKVQMEPKGKQILLGSMTLAAGPP